MLTASIAAMLADAPDSEPVIARALAAVKPFAASVDEPYTLAKLTLAALAANDKPAGEAAVLRLRSMALQENGEAYWSLETNTPFFGWGRAGRAESTAMVLRALLASGASPKEELLVRGMLFLDHGQDRHNLWYSTQATARVLDAMAAFTADGTPARPAVAAGVLAFKVDGVPRGTLALPSVDQDAGPLFLRLGFAFAPGPHTVELEPPVGAA